MSTPELKSAEPIPGDFPADIPAAPAESSSLVRWLVLAGLIAALALLIPLLLRLLPTKLPREDGGLPFAIAKKPVGPPGKVTLSESPTHDFGVMSQKQKGTHTWAFKNDGEGPLELRKGAATCSCTIANFTEDKPSFTLAPGKETKITLTWETREFDGKFEKAAAINILGDPDREMVNFVVKGVVKPAVAIMPKDRVQSLGAFANNESVKTKFFLASADHPEFRILGTRSSSPDEFKVTVVPLTDEDRKSADWTTLPGGYVVNVEAVPSKNLGGFTDEVVVQTDHPLEKEIRLTVGGKRTGPIDVVPETVRLANVNPEDGASRTVMILVRNAPDTKIEVRSAPDNVKVEVVPADLKTGSGRQGPPIPDDRHRPPRHPRRPDPGHDRALDRPSPGRDGQGARGHLRHRRILREAGIRGG